MKKSLLYPKAIAITLLIATLFFMNNANAQTTRNWTNAAGGAWNVAGNWDTGVPVAGDSVNISVVPAAAITTVPTISLLALTANANCNLVPTATGNTLTVTRTLAVATGVTLSAGTNGVTGLNMTLASTATGSILGTLTVNSPAANAVFTNSGDLTIGSAGSIGNGAGASDFSMSATGTLHIRSTTGISTTAGTGNIRVTGTRIYTALGKVIYEAAAAQVTGNATPATCDITITNTSGVALSGTLTSSGTLTVTAGSTLDMAGTNLTVAGLTGGGNLTHLTGGGVARTVSVTGAISPAVYSGVISTGTATSVALTKSGAGTLILSGANTYTGLTSITGGTLQYAANNVIASGNVTVNGATLDIAGFTDAVGTVVLSGGGSILGTTGILSSSATYDIQSGIVTAILAGAVGLTKTTVGAATLSGLNTYTGITTITAGTLSVNTLANVGAASALGAPALAQATIVINNGATLRYTGAGSSSDRIINSTADGTTIDASGTGTLALTGGITATGNNNLTITGTGNASESGIIGGGTGTFTKSGAGTWTLSGVNTFTGTTTISAGVLSVATIGNGGVTGNLGAAAGIDLSGGRLQYTGATASTNRAVVLTGTANVIEITTALTNLTISGVASGAGDGYHKAGPGTLTMAGVNTYTGPTVIDGGILSVATIGAGGASGNLGAAAIAAANLVINAGGTLQYTGATATTNRNYTINNGGNGVPPYSFIDVTNPASNLTISGANTANAAVLIKDGVGTLTLSGANLFTGDFVLLAGTVVAANVSALGPVVGPPKLLVLNGGTLTFVTDASANIYDIHVGGAVTINVGRATSGATISHNMNDVSFSPASSLTVNRGPLVTGIATLQFVSLKLWAASDFNVTANANLTFTGTVNGAIGTPKFTKSGAGTLTKNTVGWVFPGDFEINAGTYVTDQNTSVAGNWINNGGTLTGSGASRVIFNGTSAQTIGGTATTTFNGLEVNNAAGVSLTTINETVNAAVTLTTGNLTIPINRTLTIANGNAGNAFGGSPFSAAKSIVTQSDPSSTAKGFVRVNNMTAAAAYLIPSSDGTNYLPVTLTPNEALANNSYSVCVFQGVTGNGERNGTAFTTAQKNNVVDAVWFVDHNVASAASTAMTVGWPASLEGVNFTGYSNGNIGIAHWDGPNWGTPSGSGDNAANTATRTVTAFSPFGVGNPAYQALSIKIIYFNAAKGNGYNTVNWQAACTSSQVTFEVLRSTDGRNFTSINSLTASQARCAQPFNFQDNSVPQGVVYYRLKAIDVDGKETLSAIVKVSSDIKAMELTGVSPNPVSNVAQLKVNSSKVDMVHLTIISAEGQVVYRNNVQLQPGSSVINLDIAKLPAGVYMIKGMFSDGETNTVKFLKQ